MKRKYISLMVIIGFIAVIAGCAPNAEADIEEEEIPLPIEIQSTKRDTIEHTYISIGEVVPKSQVDLYVNGSGYIEKINVSIGDMVDKDQLVIQLDDSDYDWSTYNATESQLRTARDEIEAQMTTSKDNLAKQQILFSEGIVTSAEIEQLETQISSLERQFTNAEVAYKTQLSALYETLEDSVKNRTIYSPVAGKVAVVYVKEGQAVVNQVALSIIDDTELFIKTYISSDLKKQLHIGDAVNINLDSAEAPSQSGSIYQMNDLPDSSTKLFETLIKVEDASKFIIGDYAEVEFITERYDTLLIPTRAVVRSGSKEYIYIYENGSVTKALIETGRSKEDWVEIKGYITSFMVVVKGQNQLTEDSEIVVVE